MPWQFEQTNKSKTEIRGRVFCDFRWQDIIVPVRQPRPQVRGGLTYATADGRTIHNAPSRTRDGANRCPEFATFRKRLSFPQAA